MSARAPRSKTLMKKVSSPAEPGSPAERSFGSYAGFWVTTWSGDVVSRRFDDLDTVFEFHPSDDLGQLVFALQAPPCFRGRGDELEHHEPGGLGRQRSFCPHGSMTHRGEHALDRVRCAQMVPVLGGKIEEGKQGLAILCQAGDRLVVLGAVFVGEPVDRCLGRRACWRAADLAEVRLHVDLDRESDLVQHVGGFVNPTALVPGAWKDLLDRLPEAEPAVADGQVRRDFEPTSLDVDEELPPAL